MPTPTTPTAIRSPRLLLSPLSPAFLEATWAGDRAAAERLTGWAIPAAWLLEASLARRRLEDCRADPSYLPWSLRGIALRASREMVGHIGFHTPPDPEYLRPFAPGAVELGYTIFADHRRRGYATEAIRAALGWARSEHGVSRFVVSISPQNAPSVRLAAQIGFEKIGGHEDPEDGWEDVYLLEGRALERFGSRRASRAGPGNARRR